MAEKLNKGAKQKIVQGLEELYKGSTGAEFADSILKVVNEYKAASPKTDAERARVEAAKKGATVLVEVLTQFLKKKNELLNAKFVEFKNKLDEIKHFMETKDFIKDSANIGSLKTMIAEANAIRNSYANEQAHLENVVTVCSAKGLVKGSKDEILSAEHKISNAEAKVYLEASVDKELAALDELLESTTITAEAKVKQEADLRAAFSGYINELEATVEDKEQFRRDSAEIATRLIEAHKAKKKTPAPGTGTPAPGTGTPAPGTGTPAPGTGTPAPGTGTPAPGTGTPAPGTGTPAPGTGTPAPGTGTPAPGTGTPAPGTGTPAPATPYIPSDEFKTKYTAWVEIINNKIKELVAREKEVENAHLLVASSAEINYEAMEQFAPKSNMAHNIEMTILEARRNLTMLEHEEYRKNPVYYAKFDSSLLGVSLDYDKLKEVYDGNIQEYYNNHAKEVGYALGEIEKLKASATPDATRLATLQNFVIAEKNTINRTLMGYANIHPEFDLRAFLDANKEKFKAVDKAAPTIKPDGPKPEGPGTKPEGPGTKPDSGPKPEEEEIKAHLTILYKEIAKAFIAKYMAEGKGVSFEEYFQTTFVSFIAEFKTKASSGKFENLDVDKEGHLVWKEKGTEVKVDFQDFARVLIEVSRTSLYEKLQTDFDPKGKATVKLKFNTANREPQHVDTTKAIVVNAIISNEMFEVTADGKKRIKQAFIDKIVASGLNVKAGGKNLSEAAASGFIFEAKDVEGEQTITIDVKDPTGKLLCQIQVQINPELARTSGMGM